MPKERRKRVGGHNPSVKIAKRQFAVQDNAVEHLEVGSAAGRSAADVLRSMDEESHLSGLKKKERQQSKRDALLQRLEPKHSPYSKSHTKRLRQKANEQLAGTSLDDMQLALAAVDDASGSVQIPEEIAQATTEEQPHLTHKKPKLKATSTQIGEGKGAPLSKTQRQRALQLEKLRHPLILANAEFSSNPFQTIRIHAQNTLLKHSSL